MLIDYYSSKDPDFALDFYKRFMSMMEMGKGVRNLNTKQIIGWVLVVGALNWGLVGLLNMNLVETILGAGSMLTKVVYIVVGLAGTYKAYVMLTSKK